jgi:anti-sigma regulatory factor (Ser/Thr protein kinase)
MTLAATHKDESFVHEAFLYTSDDEFVRGLTSFIRAGVEASEPTLVVLSAEKIELLRAALGGQADHVLFADMGEVGANPARIIAAWQEFAHEYGEDGQPIRGIGEPIWAGRTEPELAECHRHESLLNLAFAEAPAFRLLCPYDVSALEEHVIEEAHRTHPYVSDATSMRLSERYLGLREIAEPFAAPLPEAPAATKELRFDADSLAEVRDLVAARAEASGISRARANSLVLSVNEVATNSVCHGGGTGVLKVWEEGNFLLSQVEDRGRIEEPLVGRQRPLLDQPGGRGLWLANQLCDLVQVRTFANGSAVRIHMARA